MSSKYVLEGESCVMERQGSFALVLCGVASLIVMSGCQGLVAVPPVATTYQVTVTIAGSGSGTVTSTPAGINCPTTCSASFSQGAQVALSETSGTNNSFAGWSGACTGTAACSLTVNGAEAVTATFGGSLQSLNHIIIFAQENRSFDHYFGALRQYWAQQGIPDQQFDGLPQFNPITPGTQPPNGPAPTNPGCDPGFSTPTTCVASSTAPPVPSFHMASVCNELLSPFWNEAHIDWDYTDPTGSTAALNGFVQAGANDARQASTQVNDVNGYRVMGYFDGSDLNYYYFMASNFAISDRWFAPVMSRTQLNRMYLIAGTSGGHVYPLSSSNSTGPLANMTIFEALQNAGITWKIYVNSAGTGCSDSDSACLIQNSYINMFTYYSTITGNPALLQNIASITQFQSDVGNGTLPQVALIEPASNAGLDEHPTDNDAAGAVNIQTGANYAAGLINGLMNSPSWKDSAMIFTYDEPGGFYDHVAPQGATAPDSTTSPIDLQPNDQCYGMNASTGICSFASTGYRVPLIVISPFARKNFVSHTTYDHTAILKLIETRFGLSALTLRDAAQPDLSTDFFDFVNTPWATPPTPPAQTQYGSSACSLAAPTP